MSFNKYVIADWKKCYRYLEVQVSLGIALLALLPNYIPQLQQYGVNEKLLGLLAIVGIVARVIHQESKGMSAMDAVVSGVQATQGAVTPQAVAVVNNIFADIAARDHTDKK